MTRHKCARCGKAQKVEAMTYSRFTKRRYCLDTPACEQRHVRLKKLGKIDSQGFVL